MIATPPLSLNRTCNVSDFADPELRAVIREVFTRRAAADPQFPSGSEHRKHWEVAMAIITLRRHGALHRDAEILGIGAGAEPTLFWLTNHVRRVFATDRYADLAGWEPEGHRSMLWDPGALWSGPWDPQRLVVQHMDALALQYPDESFDAVFSSGSFEHFGSIPDITRAVREAHRVLKPGGICTLSTEFLVSGDPHAVPGTMMFDPSLLEAVLGEGWELLDPFSLEIGDATRDATVPYEEVWDDHVRHRAAHEGRQIIEELDVSTYPHTIFSWHGNVFTSVHVALRKLGKRDARAQRRDQTPDSLRVADSIPAVRGLAHHLERPLRVIDAGVRWGFAPRWERLADHIDAYGFDADPEEIARLKRRYAAMDWAHLYATALGDSEQPASLRRYGFEGLESLYSYADEGFPAFAVPPVHLPAGPPSEVPMTTLAAWHERESAPPPDVLELDVQGHELSILRGAGSGLEEVLFVEVEVTLNPLFEGAPLFGAVDAELRERGFMLYRLRDVNHYPIRGAEGAPGTIEHVKSWAVAEAPVPTAAGMVSWANAVFVSRRVLDLGSPATLRSEQELLRAIVAADALLLHDVSALNLRRLIACSADPRVLRDARRALAELMTSGQSVIIDAAAPAAVPPPVEEPVADIGAAIRRRLRRQARAVVSDLRQQARRMR